MQMGFCGENFRRQRRERTAWEGKGGEHGGERRILGGVEAGRISLPRLLSRGGIGQEPESFLPKLNRKLDSH